MYKKMPFLFNAMEKVDTVIVGAGVLGLAIATEVAQRSKEVVVIERNLSFGQETSSHNSEVIHSGLYYPEGSLKARLCVEGRRLLYYFCEKHNIAHRQLGKLIVATNAREVKDLEKLIKRGKNNGVEDLTLLTAKEIKKIEPHVQAICAIQSPSTGIIDTHQLMKYLESLAKAKGVIFAYNCKVIAIEKEVAGYKVDIRDADGESLTLFTRLLINCAGLHSDKIARMAGIDTEVAGYKLHYSKGEYFRVKANKARFISHLIYPIPEDGSLGIHTVIDLQGQLKLGANAFYVGKVNYDVDPSHNKEFYQSAKKFLPFIEPDDLSVDMAGIRPKLQGPDEPLRDFVIADEEKRGFSGLINLIGIESPGLTASLAIAKYVSNMI